MNQINGICKILYLFIIAILLLSSAIASPIADTVNPNKDFGMRVRQLPLDKRINAPVIIQKAPTNEATIVKLATGELKIFFINRPGMANKMMSISSTDHGFNWTEPRVEFDLPGEAYYANQVIQGKDGTVHCIFHIFKPGQLGYRGRHLDLWYASMEPGLNM